MMEQGYKKIFWGFLITIFDINFGHINILPDFIGYFIMGLGIFNVYEKFENNNLKTANILANILMCYSLIMGIVKYAAATNIIGPGSYEHPIYVIINLILTIVINSVILIMAFKIISGTVDLYLQREMEDKAVILINKQKNYTVLTIIGLLIISICFNFSNEYYITASAIYMVVVNLYFAAILRDSWDSGCENGDAV
jgi:hypothetical protein